MSVVRVSKCHDSKGSNGPNCFVGIRGLYASSFILLCLSLCTCLWCELCAISFQWGEFFSCMGKGFCCYSLHSRWCTSRHEKCKVRVPPVPCPPCSISGGLPNVSIFQFSLSFRVFGQVCQRTVLFRYGVGVQTFCEVVFNEYASVSSRFALLCYIAFYRDGILRLPMCYLVAVSRLRDSDHSHTNVLCGEGRLAVDHHVRQHVLRYLRDGNETCAVLVRDQVVCNFVRVMVRGGHSSSQPFRGKVLHGVRDLYHGSSD